MLATELNVLMLMLISTAVNLSAHKFLCLLHQLTCGGSVHTPIWLQATQDDTMHPKFIACSYVSRHNLRKHETYNTSCLVLFSGHEHHNMLVQGYPFAYQA
jgi:hypothetical protein